MVDSIPYSIAEHARLGVPGAFCQVRLGHVVYCCKLRSVFLSRGIDQNGRPQAQTELASVTLLSPSYSPATVPLSKLVHCGGIDGRCSCVNLTRAALAGRSGARSATVARPQAGAPSNTAPSSHA